MRKPSYATSAGIGAMLLLETIFGTGCTINFAKGASGRLGGAGYRPPLALSIGTDASDTISDPSTGQARTEYSPDKPKLIFLGGVPCTYYSGYWNGRFYAPRYYRWSPTYPYISPNDTMNGPDDSFRVYP